MSHSGFEMLSFYSDGQFQHRYIDLNKVIADQRKFVSDILSTAIMKLEEEAKKHKETFKMEKLVKIFPETILYHCEKVLETVDLDQDQDFGLINLRMIEETFNNFRNTVGKRNMEFYESLEDEYQLMNHATTNLREFYEAQKQGEKPPIDTLTAYIFALFIRTKVIQLRQYAEEIDEDYTE